MPPNVAVAIELSDGERLQLEAWTRRRTSAQALALRSRIVLARGRGSQEHRDRRAAWDQSRDGGEVALAVCRASSGRADRRAAAGAAADDHRRAGRRGDHQDAGDARPRTPRTGRRGRWPARSASRRRRCRGSGGRSGCNRTARTPSSSPRTRSSSTRSTTSSGSISTRPSARSCSASTRSPRSRRSIAPPDPADAARRPRARHPRLPPRRDLEPLRRAGPHDRQGHRRAAQPPPRDRVQAVPASRSSARSRPISTSTSCSTTARPTRRRRSSSWLLAHPRFSLHFTPTTRSWLNLVERWFGELTSKLLKRGTHRSVHALNADIRAWIKTWNDDPAPLRLDQDRRPDPRLHPPLLRRINDSRH